MAVVACACVYAFLPLYICLIAKLPIFPYRDEYYSLRLLPCGCVIQERFIEKEAKRFIRLADFRKETFFNYRELVSDMCQEANYDFGVAKKKKKLKLKET